MNSLIFKTAILTAFLGIYAIPRSTALPLTDADNKTLQGIASWYSENDPGIKKTTANMEVFDDSQLTCAMWNVPMNALLKVTNLKNKKFVIVRVNDRGPAKRLFAQNRIVDLSQAAFSQIADRGVGLIPVKIEFL